MKQKARGGRRARADGRPEIKPRDQTGSREPESRSADVATSERSVEGERPAPGARERIERRDWLFAGLTAAAALGVYLVTAAPAVTSEDSGELVTAAAKWGVAHPPGYPLWCLITHLFVAFPGGEPAARGALVSAVFGALTAGAVYLVSRALGASREGSGAAALCLAVSRSFWAQAVIAEVYTLHTFLLTATVLALVRWAKSKDDRLFVAAGGLFGLGLTNHYPLLGMVAPALVAYVLLVDRRVFLRPKTVLPAIGIGLLALGIYAYLPLAARGNPPLAWGDPSTWGRFWAHVSRVAYRKVEMGADAGLAEKLRYAWYFVELFGQQVTPYLLVPFLALGAHAMRSRRKEAALLFGVMALGSVGLIALLKFPWEHEYRVRVDELYLSVYLAAAPVFALGLDQAIERARRLFRAGAPARIGAAALALPIVPLAVNFRENDLSNNHLAEDLAKYTLESLEPDAVYFTSGDYSSFPSLYLQAVRGVRTDVVLANVTGELSPEAARLARSVAPGIDLADAAAVQTALLERSGRPLYFASKSDLAIPATVDPWGFVYRARGPLPPRAKRPDILKEPVLRNADGQTGMDDLGASILADYHLMRGEALAERGDRGAARTEFAATARWSRDSKEGLNNLGSTCAERGFLVEAEEYGKSAAALSATYLTPRRNLARIFEEEGRRDDALAMYREIAKIAPSEEGAQRKIAELSAMPPDDPRVVEMLGAIRATPDNPALYNNLGNVHAERRDASRAIAAYRRALSIDPNYALAYKNLALLHRDVLHDDAAANAYLEKYRALTTPTSP